MISSVPSENGTFKLSARAMMALEQALGEGIVSLLDSLQEDFVFTNVVHFLSEAGNDGKGIGEEAALDLVDQIGFTEAGALLREIVTAAFPAADEAAPKKP